MTKKWCFLSGGLAGLLVLAALSSNGWCGQAPMVEKHIFSPEQDGQEETPKKISPEAKRVDKTLMFTGVLISPEGKRAMIQKRGRGKNEDRSGLFKEGDEIDGMLIKEIGSNFIVLASEGKDVKLKLYQGIKQRPAPPPEPRTPQVASSVSASEAASTKNATKKTAGKKATGKGGPVQKKGEIGSTEPKAPNPGKVSETPTKKSVNPFLEALKKARQKRKESGGGSSSGGSNAFLEAIKRAKGQ